MPVGRSATAGGAPSTTMQISPFTPFAAHSASSAAVPRLTSSKSFVSSRQTATRLDLPQRECDVAQRVGQPVRALEEHHRALLPRQRAERGHPTFAGHEAFEAEPVRRQSTQRERGDHGRWPRDRGDGHARGDGGGDQGKPGVADGGHAGIRQHKHVAIARELHQLGCLRLLIVLVQRNEARPVLHTERPHEVDGDPRVFGGDHLGVAERLDQPPGRIAEVADGGSREDDHAPHCGTGHQRPGPARPGPAATVLAS